LLEPSKRQQLGHLVKEALVSTMKHILSHVDSAQSRYDAKAPTTFAELVPQIAQEENMTAASESLLFWAISSVTKVL